MKSAITLASLCWIGLSCGLLQAGDPPSPIDDVVFARDVQPLLAKHCLLCHGPDDAEAGLRLDVAEQAYAVLDSGTPAIVPGDAAASELIRRITTADDSERMPPDGDPLPAEQIAVLRKWIDQGAEYQRHWAYQSVAEPPVPAVEDASWPRTPIDRFVLARLEQAGVAPSPEADRAVLIQRLYFDLIGLPPTPQEVDAFVRDSHPAAYDRLVQRLLDSPRFGERWGRHWLDKARYADSDGYEKDRPRPNAWRYRDWVIDAVNRDMPFDRFTVQQLAGDLLPGAGPMEKLATAFHRQTLTNTEGGADPEEFRVEATFDRTETTAAVWLGLTLTCARCHSHKYDQITHREYYQLFAFFNGADEADAEVPRSDAASLMSVPVLVSAQRPTKLLHRGDFLQPAEEVTAGGLEVITEVHPLQSRNDGLPPDRLDLARWLVDEDHPLTARVAVNHVWTHLFGRGLVPTVNDWGVRGDRPTHPELLDWLAWRFPRDMQWSRKSLIKTIVMSATYRQSSRHRPDLRQMDPNNDLLARQNRLRAEAEIIRDLQLSVGGLLSNKIGGPSVFPPLPSGVAEVSYANNFKWQTSSGEDRYRRGMYTFFKRTAPHPTLTSFDCPDSNTTNLQRESSNTPLQALAALNNEVFAEAAQALAHRTLREGGTNDRERLEYALRLCIARHPDSTEVDRFHELLRAARDYYQEKPADAKAVTQRHAFEAVPAAENAAWVATLRMVMNLDEFIVRD